MEESTELVPIKETPSDVVDAASVAAKKLKEIVSKHKKLVLGGNQYIFFEDWQTVGRFYGVTARVLSTEEIREGDKLTGFLCHAEAVHNGMIVSAADAECTFDEPNWKSKPRFQLRSMAQTRACAKALRNCLGWVVTLAGYSATPAEEMTDEEKPAKLKPEIKSDMATEAQRRKIIQDSEKMGYDSQDVIAIMEQAWGVKNTKELNKTQASFLIQFIAAGKGIGDIKEIENP